MKIGVDLVNIDRLTGLLNREPKLLGQWFTEEELSLAACMEDRRKFEFLAGRFAVKEAVLKALGSGIRHMSMLQEISTGVLESGEPTVVLTGASRKLAEELGLFSCAVSISHEFGLVVAFVVLS